MDIKINNKMVANKLRSWQGFLEQKTGKKVPMYRAIELAVDDKCWNTFSKIEVKKKPKSRNEYVFKI